MQHGNGCPCALLKKQRIEILHVLAEHQLIFCPLPLQTPMVIITYFVGACLAKHLHNFVPNLLLLLHLLRMQLSDWNEHQICMALNCAHIWRRFLYNRRYMNTILERNYCRLISFIYTQPTHLAQSRCAMGAFLFQTCSCNNWAGDNPDLVNTSTSK